MLYKREFYLKFYLYFTSTFFLFCFYFTSTISLIPINNHSATEKPLLGLRLKGHQS